MVISTPERRWPDSDVFIIGGGQSLKGFDWSLLEDEYTIGCNAAFILGPKICNVCFFGDFKFWNAYSSRLKEFYDQGGEVFGCAPQLIIKSPEWLKILKRKSKGLHHDGVGWNINTGASAINLALLFGATNVFLLGFDMKWDGSKKNNWHELGLTPPRNDLYKQMIEMFINVHIQMNKFPGCKVINVTDDSDLPYFEKVGVDSFFESRKGVRSQE